MPTLSSSRFKTIPKRAPVNSTSSPAIALSRPYTRAMPSPTEMTVPTSWMSTSFSKPLIWDLIRLLISSAFIISPLPCKCFRLLIYKISSNPFEDLFLHCLKLRPEAPVHDGVVHPYYDPAEKGFVEPAVYYDFLSRKGL